MSFLVIYFHKNTLSWFIEFLGNKSNYLFKENSFLLFLFVYLLFSDCWCFIFIVPGGYCDEC